MTVKNKLEKIKQSFEKLVRDSETVRELAAVEQAFLGRKGVLRALLGELKNLSPALRKERGELINSVKNQLRDKLTKRRRQLADRPRQESAIDVTLPGRIPPRGGLHPLSQILGETERIFTGLGFRLVEGPEVETERYNFDALNIPAHHPARDLWDTFWLKAHRRLFQASYSPPAITWERDRAAAGKLLLRTHTSPMQVRYLERHQPPMRIIVPGRCFRFERSDASHNIQLYQLEGLYVDQKVSIADFKGLIRLFFEELFHRKKLAIRVLPDYFPFTEPSFQVAVECVFCRGKTCRACKQSGWIELMGAGLVHPRVFKNAGYVPGEWRGFAFGIGLERLAMIKYKIDDIRLLYKGDLRILRQF